MFYLFIGLLYIWGLPTLQDEMMVIFVLFGLFVCYWRSYSMSVPFSNIPRWRSKLKDEETRTGTATGILNRHRDRHLNRHSQPAPEPTLQLCLTKFHVLRETVTSVISGISRWLNDQLMIKCLFPHVDKHLCTGPKTFNTLPTCRRSNPTNWTDSVWVYFFSYQQLSLIKLFIKGEARLS